MATINTKHLAILKNLVESGFSDEKKIGAINLNDVVKLPRCCRIDLAAVLECIKAAKDGKILVYLVDENGKPTKQEDTDEA